MSELVSAPSAELPISHLQLLEAVIEGTPDLIFVKDIRRRFVLVNSACAKLFELPCSEVYGKTIADLLEPASIREIEEVDDRVFGTGEPIVAEESVFLDGRLRTYLTTKSALRNNSGEVIGLIGISQEITERRRMVEALAESEAQYRLLTEAMPQLVWMADANGTLQYCNRHFQEFTGLSLAEATLQEDSAIHPEDRVAVKERWNKARQHSDPYEIEYRLRNAKSGTYCWFSARLYPVKDHEGQVQRWIGTAVDIDEKKNAVLEIQKREEQLRLAQKAGHIGAWTWDEDAQQLTMSSGYYELFGLTPGEAPLSPEMVAHMILPEDLERVSAVFLSKPQQELRIEYRIRKFNQIHWLLSIGRRVQADGGSTSVLAGITIDVTEQKAAEEELARQAAELARSNSDLQQFSSIASHDLQEPLRNMAICSELLHRNYRHLLDENGQQLLDLISSGARSGQALTRALLSYARAVSSEALELAPVDLNDAFQQAVSQLRTRIAETMASVASDALPKVTGDKIQLTQLFQNLIENAIKYRSEAPPAIHVSSIAHQDEWIISVRDNGVGVSEANVERIFRPFQRLLNPSVSGSGLGLATCSRIIEGHHGRIWVESHRGQGSTFFFSIPRQQET